MKDVMELDGDDFARPLPAKRVRRLIAIPRTSELEDTLARMRQHGSHGATSADDEGATRGLLFLEDAIEVLVGEIHEAAAA